MALRIEDYALIGDTRTAALVGRDGSIDWLCLPRFDSAACFAALLGDETHGRWRIAPAAEVERITRRYLPGTLVLETEFQTADGVVRLVDACPCRSLRRRSHAWSRAWRVESGCGWTSPCASTTGGSCPGCAGSTVRCRRLPGRTPYSSSAGVPTHGENMTTLAEFEVVEGESVPFLLTWHPSEQRPPGPIDVREAISDTAAWWQEWSERAAAAGGPWHEPCCARSSPSRR